MSVPAEIRAVQRPVNTVVVDNGRDGPHRYAVRERAGTRYVAGGNPQPRNGKVLGHIDAINLVYIPLETGTVVSREPEELSYGACALFKSVTADILPELLQVFPGKDAYMIIAIAALRVIKPSIPAKRLSSEYHRTFISRFYPGVPLSPNTVGAFLERLGMDGTKRRAFFQLRAAAVMADHHVAIDGTLKQDTSKVNDLSAFSYKARTRGCKEISVLYAYDIEAMEPICAEVFPGNFIDASSYATFIRDNDIQKGIIVADKGFPPSRIEEELKARPDLHFLTPLKRNDVRISNNNMLAYDGVLSVEGKRILYRKAAIKGGRFLYSFKDVGKASAEEASFIARSEKNQSYDQEKYLKKKDLFGVIVFESDQDLPPKTVYTCYEDRWLIELVFHRYKSDDRLDKTSVQGDFTVIGSEFINFIATLATCRILRKAEDAGVMDGMSYGDLMDDLSTAWRKTDAPTSPRTDDGCWVHTTNEVFEELEALGLSEPVPKPEPKKRGRPKKIKDPEAEKPKRPRGRPRKNPVPG